MSITPKLSLVIAVYNKPEHLRLVLAGCARQSFTDFEIIIADDGSGPEIKKVVEEAKPNMSNQIVHLWHEDLGWRKNIMLNNGIRAARGEQIVFIDGDCIPGKDFMLDHWNEREPNRVLLGRRVETSERWSTALTVEKVQVGEFERYGFHEWMDGLLGRSLRVEDGIRIRSRLLRTILLRNVHGMLGSNFSAAKKDLEAVNGLDEEYTGPGCGEDSDIQYRLSLIGVTGKSLRNLAIQYHIHHPLTRTSEDSWQRFRAVRSAGAPRCKLGLTKH